MSDIRTASYFHWQPVEQKLYWINFAIVLIYILKDKKFEWSKLPEKNNYYTFWKVLGISLAIITLLAFIAINTHGPEQGHHQRFPTEKVIN